MFPLKTQTPEPTPDPTVFYNSKRTKSVNYNTSTRNISI